MAIAPEIKKCLNGFMLCIEFEVLPIVRAIPKGRINPIKLVRAIARRVISEKMDSICDENYVSAKYRPTAVFDVLSLQSQPVAHWLKPTENWLLLLVRELEITLCLLSKTKSRNYDELDEKLACETKLASGTRVRFPNRNRKSGVKII